MFPSGEKEKMKNKNGQGKNGQMAGQILIYVLAIIVFSLTLVYGYRAIKHFTDTGEEISYLQLENDIKSEVEKVQGDTMGTVKKKVLQIPGRYKHVCFFNSLGRGSRSVDLSDYYYDLIKNSLDGTDNNMFLAPPGDVNFNIGDIEIENIYDCVNITGGKVTLRIESMGDHVKISGWG